MKYKLWFSLSGLLMGYGVFAMIMNYRSALRGGGLMGGLGEIIIGLGLLGLIITSVVYLVHKQKNKN